MEKNNPINYILNYLVSKELITAAYIEKRAQDEREIYLHIVSKREKFNEIDTAMENISLDIPVVVYYKNFEGYLYFKFDNGFSCFLLKSDESYDIYTNSLIVYDRFNKLKPVPLSYTDELKGKIINEITFLFDRFINFYIIKDVISSMQYLLEISEKIIEFLSVLLEVPKVHRNNISALKTVGEEFASKLLEIVEGLNIDTVKETSIKMFVFIDKFVSSVPINVAYSIDIDYYNYIKKELLKL